MMLCMVFAVNAQELKKGDKLPDFHLKSAVYGDVSSAELKGKVVLVSFLSLYFDDEKWRPEVGDTEFFFFDRAFLENLVIAKYRLNQQDLTQDEFDILCKLAHGIASLMPPVDKYLYLDCSVSTIIEHMRQRGREYEDDLDLMYVYELKELYDEWAKTLPPERTLRINMDGGEYDLNEIVRFLEA